MVGWCFGIDLKLNRLPAKLGIFSCLSGVFKTPKPETIVQEVMEGCPLYHDAAPFQGGCDLSLGVRRMGTHPSGPATVLGNDKALTLKQWIEEHLEALGDRVLSQFGADLPFLFKVGLPPCRLSSLHQTLTSSGTVLRVTLLRSLSASVLPNVLVSL
jgi:hypothetical protein